MIAPHVWMQVPPQRLDAIGIWRVRGQEVQCDAPVELLGRPALHQAAGMNTVVVEDHVEFSRARERVGQPTPDTTAAEGSARPPGIPSMMVTLARIETA